MKLKICNFFLKNLIMNFKQATETYSIVSCSTKDTPPRNLCIIMTFLQHSVVFARAVYLGAVYLKSLLQMKPKIFPNFPIFEQHSQAWSIVQCAATAAPVVNAHEKSKVGVIREKEKVSKVLDDLNLSNVPWTI